MNVPAGPSRVGAARRRAGLAKRAVAVSSAAAFAVALVLARVSHPGHAASQGGSTSGATAVATDDDGFDFGSGSIAPSGGSAPTVQSNGS
jgi:hypothetical protein